MINEELQRVIDEAKNGEFVSLNGAFLEFLRAMAKNDQIGMMAEAIDSYTKELPNTKSFIIARLPAIILDSYIVYKVTAKIEVLDDWLSQNNSWSEDIKSCATNPESLALTVGNILTSVATHSIV